MWLIHLRKDIRGSFSSLTPTGQVELWSGLGFQVRSPLLVNLDVRHALLEAIFVSKEHIDSRNIDFFRASPVGSEWTIINSPGGLGPFWALFHQ